MRPYFCQCKECLSSWKGKFLMEDIVHTFVNNVSRACLLILCKTLCDLGSLYKTVYICMHIYYPRKALDIALHLLSPGFMFMAQKPKKLGHKGFEE